MSHHRSVRCILGVCGHAPLPPPPPQSHACMHTHEDTHGDTRTRTHTHTDRHTHVHTHACTHACTQYTAPPPCILQCIHAILFALSPLGLFLACRENALLHQRLEDLEAQQQQQQVHMAQQQQQQQGSPRKGGGPLSRESSGRSNPQTPEP